MQLDIGRVFSARLCVKWAIVFGLTFFPLWVQPAYAQNQLQYFKYYWVTGDYAVAGVGGLYGKGVNGSAKGTINFSGVPCTLGVGSSASIVPCTTTGAVPAELIAAYLYWQETESTSPSEENATFDNQTVVGLRLGNPQTAAPACGSNGNTVSNSFANVYRADVLRYLAIDTTNNVQLVNGSHTVALPDSGTAGKLPLAEGASLLVVYHVVVPGKPKIALYRAVVIYDGAYTAAKNTAGLNLTMGALFASTSTSPAAKMSYMVGNAQSNSQEGVTINAGGFQQVRVNPFTGAQGAHWDNYTWNNFNLSANAASVQTLVNTDSCVTLASVVMSANIQDTDFDGIPDAVETGGLHLNPGDFTHPATFGKCADYPTEPCVNLPAMGANPNKPDIFMQIDWMHGVDGSGGLDKKGTHDHMPNQQALSAVCATFAAHNIALHFDVGNNYQGQPCIIPYRADQGSSNLALGGSDIDEATLLCPNPKTSTCAFPEPYAVLSWKIGFDAIKNGFPLLGIPQHFPHDRKDLFHYVLFAHALAALFDSTGKPLTKDPLSISGVADRPGGDLMVTLGLWPSGFPAADQVGTVIEQAGTLMHELGHNLDLSHYGLFRKPNCAPNYQSVMNYFYQTGLTDAQGSQHIDYSAGTLNPLIENSLSSTASLGHLNYQVLFYGPPGPNDPQDAPAQVHCDGTSPGPNEPPAVRLQNKVLATPDWSNGTVPLGTPFKFDVNYDGISGETFTDQPDWSSLNLQQVGARPNVNGLSGDVGVSDLGVSDLGVSDLGVSDLGVSDLGVSDLGVSDLGVSDLGDIDYITHVLSSVDPPPSQSPTCPTCGLSVQPELGSNNVGYNQLAWTPPSEAVDHYNIYRCAGGASCTLTFLASVPVTASNVLTPTYSDTVTDFMDAGATCPANLTCYNTTYTYAVTAVVNLNGKIAESLGSNQVSGEVPHLFVIANNKGHITYGGGNPNVTAAFTVYGDGGSVSPTPTCAYYPSGTPGTLPLPASVTPKNVGTYPILCTSTATTGSGGANVGVSYNVTYLSNVPGTLIIDPAPLTANVIGSQTYGATSISYSANNYTGFQYGENSSVVNGTPSCSTTAVAKSTVAGSPYVISNCSGLSSSNYKISYTYGAFTVNPAPLLITVTGSQTYGGANLTYTPGYAGFVNNEGSGVLGGTLSCSTTGLSATTPVASSLTVTSCSGLSDSNYTISFTYGAFTVNRAPLTATIIGSQTYGGSNKTFSVSGYATFVNSQNLSVVTDNLANCATTVTNSSSVATSPYSSTISGCTGLTAANYMISYASGAFTVTPAPLSVTVTGSQTYGSNAPTYTPAYSGFVNNEGAGVLGGTLSCSTTGLIPATPVASSLPVTSCTGLSDSNYLITFTYGAFTVNRAPLTATIIGSQVYGGSNKTFSVSGYATFVNSENFSVVTNNLANCATTVTSTSSVATYSNTISGCTGLTAANYAISYASGAFTVTPQTLSINVTGSQTYGGANLLYTPVYSGFVNGEGAGVLGAALSCSTNGLTPTSPVVGNNLMVTSCANFPDTNYTYNFTYGAFTVVPAPQTITFAPLPDMVLGDSDFAVTATASSTGPVTFSTTTSNSCSVTSDGTDVHLIATGPCTITASQAGGGNYLAAMMSQSFNVTNIVYTNDSVIGDFTGNVIAFAQFDAGTGLVFDGGALPYTPSVGSLSLMSNTAYRIYPSASQPIIVEFSSPVSKIRVFPNMDHLGSPYDGFQYAISGCPDSTGMNCTLLFNAITVVGEGEPFTLGTFAGTAPLSVNNVLTPGTGPGGTIGYVADFSFRQAYTYYRFDASKVANDQGNADEELSAVASVP